MKAIALLSGGLDSTLAIRVVLEQNVEVIAVNFVTPFCLCNRRSGCGNEARKTAKELGVNFKFFNIASEYLEIVKNPKYGYGKNINPCIDCRILMHRKAKEYMEEIGASFLITGEVLGQRPMSQHRHALRIIEKESGLEGLVLRPLSAKLLPTTIPEREGWVDREKLLTIHGRSRKPQMKLADEFGITDYPCPAGGCLLTDPGFARRAKDLLEHDQFTMAEIAFLRVGRHFRLSPSAKLVVGRNKDENDRLERLAEEGDICFTPTEVMGPIGLGRGAFAASDVRLACQIVARYCDGERQSDVKIALRELPRSDVKMITSRRMDDAELQDFRI